jgi:hypothetical protein
MSFWDKLWCWWHRICTIHLLEKQFGIGTDYCPECRKRIENAYEERLTRLRGKRQTGVTNV